MTTKSRTEIINLLHKCAEIERVLGKLYDLFAATFHENREISRLFNKTAGEERNHEYQIRLAIKSFSSAIESMNITTDETDRHLALAMQTLDDVESAMPGIEEALKLSINLEATFSRFHMDTAAQFSDISCGKLFTAMMAADGAHVAALEKALAAL
ncbi:MAG TPA: hypothetical protein PLI53_05905 [Geobacteraceae bacterium]|nr:hypothetical protein [Geobacteraceae bacterium]